MEKKNYLAPQIESIALEPAALLLGSNDIGVNPDENVDNSDRTRRKVESIWQD